MPNVRGLPGRGWGRAPLELTDTLIHLYVILAGADWHEAYSDCVFLDEKFKQMYNGYRRHNAGRNSRVDSHSVLYQT